MHSDQLKSLFNAVRAGTLSPEEALARVPQLPFEDLGYACIDTHRQIRTGVPEVIYCAGKTDEQVLGIARRLAARYTDILATRADPGLYARLREALPDCVYHEKARIVVIRPTPRPPIGQVALVSAGTSDMPVAEEAAVTAETLGSRVVRFYDVGVAGVHRLLGVLPELRRAHVCVVAAGMEGALASVVGGLVAAPVIALPTSVGYGASFGGIAALLAMLNSCAAGVSVVNIDNGFGAGYQAHLINRLAVGPDPAPDSGS